MTGKVESLQVPAGETSFAADVRAGLGAPGQKTLPPKYLYDPMGSSLFEAITQLPEYGLWRAERRLLEAHAEEIARRTQAASVIELGSGSATKSVYLLKALLRRQAVSYWTIDMSTTAVQMTRQALGGLHGLSVHSVESDYLAGLHVALRIRPADQPVLVMFLGSSLGNFDALASARFLQRIRQALRPGDGLLLGADLEKPERKLLAAYDDSLGVTAAFNLNLLARMNSELGADFSVPQFRHRARYNAATRDVEMHIESLCDQAVHFPDGFSASFRAGETIHTESSHKYRLEELAGLAQDSGFGFTAQWLDQEAQFVSLLCSAAP
jgi:L-histidine N-alpha-methyltransferase